MNTIVIELCAEDRARLDAITARLEALATQTQFLIEKQFDNKTKEENIADDLRKALEDAINDVKPSVVETAQEDTKETTPTITPQVEETPKKEEPKPTVATKTVSRAELGAKVREMMTKGFKEETKAIVKDYAPTVPGVPEDKVTECYERLVALEG